MPPEPPGGIEMRPAKRQDRSQQDLLRSRLDQIVDPADALVKMARAIDWDSSKPNSTRSTSTVLACRLCPRG